MSDTLHLWWLGRPDMPRYIGELHLFRPLKGVSLRYATDWLASGFPLSENLPLIPQELLPTEPETAAGAVDDARPDRWGERVIRLIDKPRRLAVLDYLYYAGHERLGALGVSTSATQYAPHGTGPLPRLADAAELQELALRVLAGEPVEEPKRRLIAPGATLGGARPKALITLDGHPWVLKFNEPGDPFDASLVEHATLTLAAQAGIRVAQTRPVKLNRGHALAIKRFDRSQGIRLHALSANVALKAAGMPLGYPELAQWLRRRGVAAGNLYQQHMHELFRRMVFNILIDNTDDHEKNHALLMTPTGEYELSPAYDILPTGQALGYQQLRVGLHGHDATLDNALSECRQFGLTLKEARQHIQAVVKVVEGWQAHFAHIGVSGADQAFLSPYIRLPGQMPR